MSSLGTTKKYSAADGEILSAPAVTEWPPEWRLAKLGDHLELIRNGLTKKQNRDGRGYPVTRIETIANDGINVNKVGYVEDITEKDIEKYRLRKGDILLSHINSEPQIGRSVVCDALSSPLLHGMNLLMLRAKAAIDPHFLNFLFAFYRRVGFFIRISARSVNQNSINQGKMKAVTIPVPSLREQRAIVRVLRTAQLAKEMTEKVVAAARQLKQSLMRHLFTYGPVPFHEADRVELSETEVGLIPGEWEVARVSSFARTATGGTPSRKRHEYFGGEIPWVKSGELGDGLVRQTEETISAAGLENSNAKIFPSGTLLMALYGATTGKVGILDIEAATNQAVCAIFPDRDVSEAWYLFYALIHRREDLLTARYGGAQPNISQTLVRNLALTIPSLDQQRKIVHALRSLDHKIGIENQRRDALESCFGSLLQKLMSGQTRVQDLDLPAVTEAV